MSYTKLDKLHDRVTIWLDMAVWYAVALWAVFVTLPSLDESYTVIGRNGETQRFHPSRGTPGSCFVTHDGQHYVRTPNGTRKIGKVLGAKLIARAIRNRRMAIARRVIAVATALTIAICIALLSH